MAKIDRRVWVASPASQGLRSFSQKKFGAGRPHSHGVGPQTVEKKWPFFVTGWAKKTLVLAKKGTRVEN
jgi:hypothetical protein